MSFVAKFNVDDNTIMMNKAEFDDVDVILIDKVILMF